MDVYKRMKIAVLSANLGNFDKPVDPVTQEMWHGEKITFFRFVDDNFPPITGLTPRLQYRIPKLFGWDMVKGYDVYIWLDGSMSLQVSNSVDWFLQQLGDADMAVFRHPWRKTIKQEVDHIEDKLQSGNEYITSRYKNGLHKEQYKMIVRDNEYTDNRLFASMAFVYKNNKAVEDLMMDWWALQSRFFTCDQISMTYAIGKHDLRVNVIDENVFKIPYVSLVSRHK